MQVFQTQYQPIDRPIEDRIAVAQPRVLTDNRTVVGVFDGHGGPYTAEYLSQHLLSEILEAIPPHSLHDIVPEKLQAIFDAFDAKILSNVTENFRFSLKVPVERIRQNLISKKLCQGGIRDAVERAKSGATALVAYVEEAMLYLANTGDCRAVMGRLENDGSMSAHQLTDDLNAKNPLERARLMAKQEEFAIVGERVLGQMEVTRSFGDAFFKLKNTNYTRQVFGHPLMTPKGKMSMHETHSHLYPHIISPPYLIPTPVTSTYPLSDAEVFLVLASDGLWDTAGVSNAWVVETVDHGLRTGQNDVAQFLLDRVKEIARPGDD
ncbi:hypothetical protein PILCRDRAFT_16801, partial [Piloderma croceum F 1598]